MPKYKIRTEGGHINWEDEIMLCSLAAPGFQLHESKQAGVGNQIHKGGYNYNEANLSKSAVDAAPTIRLYARYTKGDSMYLHTGAAVRFFDRELEGFFQGFCFSNAHRDDGPKKTMLTLQGNLRLLKDGLEAVNEGLENAPGMKALQSLNPIDDTKLRSDLKKAAKTAIIPHIAPPTPNALHPDMLTAKSVFVIETVGRQVGGLVEWNKQMYRIRHLATGKYLTVGREDVKRPSQNPFRALDVIPGVATLAAATDAGVKVAEGVQKMAEKAAADAAKASGAPPPTSDAIGGKKEESVYRLTLEDEVNSKEQITRQTFQFRTVEVSNHPFLPKDDVMISVVHVYSDGTELFLHSNSNRTICMSSYLRSYDCALLCHVPEKQADMIKFLRDIKPPLWRYCVQLGEERKFPESSSELELEMRLLGRLILESMIGGKDPSLTDPLKAESLPLTVFQNAARDQAILDLLFAIIQAPVNAEMLLSYSDKNEEKKADWDDKDFKPLVTMHKLAWKAVMALVKNNTVSEMYLVSIAVKTVPRILKEDDRLIAPIGVPAFDRLLTLVQKPPPPPQRATMAPGEKKKLEEESKKGIGSHALALFDEVASGVPTIDLPGGVGGLQGVTDYGAMEATLTEWGDDPMKLINTIRPEGLPAPWGRPDDDPFKAGPPPADEKPWIEGDSTTSVNIIINQISYPLGAAELLTSLIDNNPMLMAKVVDTAMIEYFKLLIRNEGPSARFMQFFQAINSCQGRAIKLHQEMCLTELINNQADFEAFLIRVYTVEVASPKLNFIDSISKKSKPMSDKYLGKEVLVDGDGFPRVFVSWKGVEKWEMGSDYLFYSPSALDIATYENVHVPIEEMCWPLEPERLYPIVKGKPWADLELAINEDETRREIFERHSMLANYFKSQIDLYAEMLRDRSYHVIFVVEKMFPYPMILSLIANPHLPFTIRSSAMRLLKNLWIQRYPHEGNCGRQSIPSRLWIYSALRDVKITDIDALPQFSLSSTSSLLKNPDPFYSMSHAHKFWMLNRFTSSFFSSNGIVRQVSENKMQNICVRELVSLVADLQSLGFYPTCADIDEVQASLIAILDGRSDVERDSSFGGSGSGKSIRSTTSALTDGDGAMKNPDCPIDSVKRYRLDEKTLIIFEGKKKIIEVLLNVFKFRNQFRIAKFMYHFRQIREAKGKSASKLPTTQEAIASILSPTDPNCNALNLETLTSTGIPISATLMDLMMYEDDRLFELAFTLLSYEKLGSKTILDALDNIMILEDDKLPEFGTFEQMESACAELRRLLGTAEVWGEKTPLNPKIDINNYKEVWALFTSISNFLKVPPLLQRQELLFLLDVHGTLFLTLRWDFDAKAKEADASSASSTTNPPAASSSLASLPLTSNPVVVTKPSKNSLFKIAEYSIELLITMVAKNPTTQMALLDRYEVILNQAKHFPRAYNLLIEIFKGSKEIVLRTPPALFGKFGGLLGTQSTTILAQVFFLEQLLPDRNAVETVQIERNQKLTVQAIGDTIKSGVYKFDLTTVQSDKQFAEYIAVVEILALCCKHNREVSTRMVRPILPWELIAARVCQVIKSGPLAPGYGLGLKEKEPPKLGDPEFATYVPPKVPPFSPPDGVLAKSLRSRFMSSSLNFLSWVNLDPKGVDARIVGHNLMLATLTAVAKTLSSDEGTSFRLAALSSKDTVSRLAIEDQVMAEVSFLLALVKTEVCTDSTTLHAIEKACVRVSTSKYSRNIVVQAKKAVDLLRPGEAMANSDENFSFRPNRDGGDVDTSRGSINGGEKRENGDSKHPASMSLADSFKEFVAETRRSLEPVLREEKSSILRTFLQVKELTDPNDPAFLEKQAKMFKEEEEKEAAAAKSGGVTDNNNNSNNNNNMKDNHKMKSESRTNKITWKNITQRMIGYVDYTLQYDKPITISRSIIEMYVIYLEEAKAEDAKKTIVPGGEEVESELKKRQLELNSFNIIGLIFRVIGNVSARGLFTPALRLGILMMEGGNLECQNTLMEYAKTHDADGLFFMGLQKVLNRTTTWVTETKYNPLAEVPPNFEVTNEVLDGISVLQFLSELCAGHNFAVQDALRDQLKFNRTVYNLVGATTELIEAIIPRRDVYRHICMAHMELLLYSFKFLIEATMGPCPANQLFISGTKTFTACKVILSCKPGKKIDQTILAHVKCAIAQLLCSCLEGRHGTEMEKGIMTTIEQGPLNDLHNELFSMVTLLNSSRQEELVMANEISSSTLDGESSSEKMYTSLPSSPLGKTQVPNEDGVVPVLLRDYTFTYKPLTKAHLELTLKDLTTVREKLAIKSTDFNAVASADVTFSSNYLKFKESLRSVEVSWNGFTETAYFPLVNECRFLSESTKADFLSSCELGSSDLRVKALMENLDNFFDEMVVFEKLTLIPGYKWMMQNYFYYKFSIFLVSVLINVNVILTWSQSGPQDSYFAESDLSDSPTTDITLGLGSALMGGYLFAVLYWMIPSFSITAKALTRQMASRDAKQAAMGIARTSWFADRNWDAFNMMMGGIVFFVCVCIVHYYAQIDTHTFDGLIWTYLYTFFVLFGSWIIYAFRSFIQLPTGPVDYFICLIMDSCSNYNALVNLAFLGCTIAGLFTQIYMFSICLLDYILLSEYAKNVVKSIVRPRHALLSLLIVYLCVLVIFGMFGVSQFGLDEYMMQAGALTADDQKAVDDTKPPIHTIHNAPDLHCDSLTECVALVFYGGIRTFDVTALMDPTFPGNYNFSTRIWYDILFFITLGMLLSNMLTGIIVDTFADLRGETQERNNMLTSETFISGLDNDTIEASGGATNFDTIQNESQNMWNYVYFIFYLKKKNPALYDGLEAYVAACVDSGDHSWLPKRTCAAMEMAGAEVEGDAMTMKLDTIQERLAKMERAIVALSEKVK